MKIIILAAVISAVNLASYAQAPQYEISWHTIDSGAHTLSGGNYILSGIIGQPDAGPEMTGNGYSLTGGFLPKANPTAHINNWTIY